MQVVVQYALPHLRAYTTRTLYHRYTSQYRGCTSQVVSVSWNNSSGTNSLFLLSSQLISGRTTIGEGGFIDHLKLSSRLRTQTNFELTTITFRSNRKVLTDKIFVTRVTTVRYRVSDSNGSLILWKERENHHGEQEEDFVARHPFSDFWWYRTKGHSRHRHF